jgi:hypothetical protein
LFSSPIPIRMGERVTRDGFEFCDVLFGEAAPEEAPLG